jgi:[ribosomal protein S18]-alanine N-acetyltransferase
LIDRGPTRKSKNHQDPDNLETEQAARSGAAVIEETARNSSFGSGGAMRRPSHQAKFVVLGLLKTATAFAANPSSARYPPQAPSLFGSLSFAAAAAATGRTFLPDHQLLNGVVVAEDQDLKQVRKVPANTGPGSSTLQPPPARRRHHVELRVAQPSDFPSLAECNERTLPENYCGRWYQQHLTDWPDLAFVIVEKERRVVAYLLGKTHEVAVDRRSSFGVGADGSSSLLLRATRRSEHVGHVSSLAVLPEFRRQGLASQLMDAFHERIERKCQSVSLHCRTSNKAAVRLYESSGYEASYTIPNYYEDGEDAYFMKKVFKPSSLFERLRPMTQSDLLPKVIWLRELDEHGRDNRNEEETTEMLSGIM